MIIMDYAHPTWNSFLNNQKIKNILKNVNNSLENVEYNPSDENILRFLKNDLLKVKIVIIGQDTYPAKGVATGRAFEVGGLTSWESSFRQVSLKNIIRSIYSCYNPNSEYVSYSKIKNDISKKAFNILPPNKLWDSWESQGVMLINGAFTCEVGKAGSHIDIWKDFMIELLKYIAENTDVIFFLWGSYALSFEPILLNHKVYKSRHPMMCSNKYEDDFLKNPCFEETKNIINWKGEV